MSSLLRVLDFIHASDEEGLVDYVQAYDAMREFTRECVTQASACDDQMWLLEHAAVFTQGQAGKPEHVVGELPAPLVETDRGGQVTYHGPGQLMFYLLADVRRLGLNVRELVQALENTVIDCLAGYGIEAYADRDAPGVYVADAKIAALGLRVTRGRCYHGLCFNYRFDDSPFGAINPCGYEGLRVTQLSQLASPVPEKVDIVAKLVGNLVNRLGYDGVIRENHSWPAFK